MNTEYGHSEVRISGSQNIPRSVFRIRSLLLRQLRSLVVRVVETVQSFDHELHQVGFLRRSDLDIKNFFIEPLVRDASFGVVVDDVIQSLRAAVVEVRAGLGDLAASAF